MKINDIVELTVQWVVFPKGTKCRIIGIYDDEKSYLLENIEGLKAQFYIPQKNVQKIDLPIRNNPFANNM